LLVIGNSWVEWCGRRGGHGGSGSDHGGGRKMGPFMGPSHWIGNH